MDYFCQYHHYQLSLDINYHYQLSLDINYHYQLSLDINYHYQLSLDIVPQLANEIVCMKFCSGVYVLNSTVNNVLVGDWTDELAIIVGNVKQLH